MEENHEVDWNERYKRGETPWDKGLAAPSLLEFLRLKTFIETLQAGTILVPGCGTGHDVRVLSENLGREVIGIDLAPLAIEKARAHISVGLEHYEEADWFTYQNEQVAAIWEHTCYCAIHPIMRDLYVATAARLLSEGGTLFGVFFLDTGSKCGPPWSSTREEIEERFSLYFECVASFEPSHHYEGREGREWCYLFRRKGEVKQ